MSYIPYTSYKKTTSNWINFIPNTWDIRKIKSLGTFQNGFGFPDRFQGNNEGDIPFLKVSDINNPSETYVSSALNYVSSSLAASMNWKLTPVDSIIFPKIGVALLKNHRKINETEVIIDNNMSAFVKSENIINKYLFYIFKELDMKNFVNISAVPSINFDLLKNFQIPITLDVTQQQQIANYLDKQTVKIDETIAKNKELIKLLEEKRVALINQVVTKGLNPDVSMKDSGVEWIGEIPEHWGCRKINTISSVSRGASPRPIDDPIYFDEKGEYSWVRISDVTSSNKYLEKTTEKLSTLGKSLSVPIEPGNIFVSIAATVGKPIIANIKCCIHDGFVYFKNLDLNDEYLFYIFAGGEAYKGLGKLGTQLNLNTETIGRIYIPIPPEDEQTKIINYLDEEIDNVDKTIQKVHENINLLTEYKTSLIHHVVTGKIDVRGEEI